MQAPALKKDNGVHISKEQRNEWAKEAYNHLLFNPKEEYYRISSGDSAVEARRLDGFIDVHDYKIRRFWATWQEGSRRSIRDRDQV